MFSIHLIFSLVKHIFAVFPIDHLLFAPFIDLFPENCYTNCDNNLETQHDNIKITPGGEKI